MADLKKFFVLPEAISASHTAHMIGRVVEDRLDPLRSFAPIDVSPSSISPDIQPETLVWRDHDDFVSSIRSSNVSGGVASLINLKRETTVESTFRIQSPEVKSYLLVNTHARFLKLMEHDTYAKDVKSLLARSKSGIAYLVTGFATAMDGTFSELTVHSKKMGAKMMAPVFQASGALSMRGDGALNPIAIPERETEKRKARTMRVDGEVIFAVSYDVISRARRLFNTTIQNTGPVHTLPRAKKSRTKVKREMAVEECSPRGPRDSRVPQRRGGLRDHRVPTTYDGYIAPLSKSPPRFGLLSDMDSGPPSALVLPAKTAGECSAEIGNDEMEERLNLVDMHVFLAWNEAQENGTGGGEDAAIFNLDCTQADASSHLTPPFLGLEDSWIRAEPEPVSGRTENKSEVNRLGFTLTLFFLALGK